jgi:transposase
VEQSTVERDEKSHFSQFPCLRFDVAGVDISASTHFVALPEGSTGPAVSEFVAETCGLVKIAELLKANNVKIVAMEATGIYWIPVYNHLEQAGFEVALLNPYSVKNIQGRKTDVLDCQWIRTVYSHGLVDKSFVPTKDMVAIREMVRMRMELVESSSREINHMIKFLRMMNINLERAVTDITGMTGMNIISAILSGERDPLALAQLRDPRCKKSAEEIATCLDGVYTVHHLAQLSISRDAFLFYRGKIEYLDSLIMTELISISQKNNQNSSSDNGKDSDEVIFLNVDSLTDALRLITNNGVDLTKIEGIGPVVALIIISQIGTDMSRWKSVKHFSSWLGLCPNNRKSGGKVQSHATRKVNSRVAWALRMAANSLRRSKSALGDFFRKMIARQGPQKAITSVAHKLAVYVYTLLSKGQEYFSNTLKKEEIKAKTSALSKMTKRLARLGYRIEPIQPESGETEAVSSPVKSEAPKAAKKRGRPRKDKSLSAVLSPA